MKVNNLKILMMSFCIICLSIVESIPSYGQSGDNGSGGERCNCTRHKRQYDSQEAVYQQWLQELSDIEAEIRTLIAEAERLEAEIEDAKRRVAVPASQGWIRPLLLC